MMTRQNAWADQWRNLFSNEHAALGCAVKTFLSDDVPTTEIIESALSAVEGYPFNLNFASGFALRVVVKAAIAFSIGSRPSIGQLISTDNATAGERGARSIGCPPWSEHSVYFLRVTLQYSRRDTALLLGVTDADVDELTRLAATRM